MSADTADIGLDDFSDLDSTEQVTEKERPAGTTRSSSKATPTGGARRGRPRKNQKLTDLQEKLSGQMYQAGFLVGLPLPVTGYYVCQESDSFTKAVVELAATRPEWINALENIARLEPGLIIGRTAIGIGGAMAVDRRRASPDSPFMRFLGVYNAWQKLEQKKDPGERPDVASNYQPPPSTYQPIS